MVQKIDAVKGYLQIGAFRPREVVSEANDMLELPGTGTLVNQLDQIMAALGI